MSKSLNQLRAEMAGHVEQFGHSVMLVGGGFAYTIGMASHGHSDFIISTDDMNMAHWLLNLAASRFAVSNECPEGVYSDIIDHKDDGLPMPIHFAPVALTKEFRDNYVAQARYFYDQFPKYEQAPMSVVQILWPDNKGLLPYEAGYNAERFRQELFADCSKLTKPVAEPVPVPETTEEKNVQDDIRVANAAYYGTFRDMPVGQLFYIQKANGGYPMDYQCEFVTVDARGYIVAKIVANHSSAKYLRNDKSLIGYELKARAKECYLFLKANLSHNTNHWFPSLDMPALKK